MPHLLRALAVFRPALAAVLLYAVAAGGAGFAQSWPATAPTSAGNEVRRAMKLFDFDERPLGNYEDTPMHWRRLTGDGLPAYSAGRLDEGVGHRAPPAFLFTLRGGGNIAYEYAHTDLTITPNSDYLIEGYIRADDLEYAGALVVCFLVDEAGQRIPGSERTGALIRSASGAADDGWQRIEIPLHVEYPHAYALRLQLWVLQDHVWEAPPENELDPIVRQDVDARVWFDDLAVVRQPRARLWFSNPGGLVKPGASEAVHLDVHNSTSAALRVDVTLADETGTVHLRDGFDLAPQEMGEHQLEVPPLPPGLYTAAARVTVPAAANDAAEAVLLCERTIRLAVLPNLPPGSERTHSFGVDLGPWSNGAAEGAMELIGTLGCGAVKIGLPMIGRPSGDNEAQYFQRARELARRLAVGQVETTGVILAPGSAETGGRRLSTYRMLVRDSAWSEAVGPVLAYFGGHVAAWQLGREEDELREAATWDNATLRTVQRKLERFVAVPQLIIPRSVLDTPVATDLLDPDADAGSEESSASEELLSSMSNSWTGSYWLPADLPARALPWHLAFWLRAPDAGSPGAEPHSPDRWLSLGIECVGSTPADRAADFGRRVVLAAVVNPDRLFVPAPFELLTTGGNPAWQPTPEYIPLRTLWRFLGDSRAVASQTLPGDGVAVLFRRADKFTMAAWTWREEAGSDVDLFLGAEATATDLCGAPQPLHLDGPLAHVRLSPAPLLISNVNAPLLQLPDNFNLEPKFIEAYNPESRPLLTLRNPYPGGLAGTIALRPPTNWHVSPAEIHVELGPGDTLRQPLEFTVPPRQTATVQQLGVELRLRHPDAVTVHLDTTVQVGLRDIAVDAAVRWNGDDLVVEQTLQNRTSSVVSFNSFCQPPQRPQLEGALLNVGPSEVRTQIYRIPAARDLAGANLWIGVREIGGSRSLDQLVLIPE
jgi:hypothetical protein